MACLTATWRSLSLSAVSPWITSPFTGGSSGSLPSSSRRRAPAVTLPATGGSPTRLTWRSPAGGPTCTGAVDQHGQVLGVLLSQRRDLAAARRFFVRALRGGTIPAEVTTDWAAAHPRVLDELIPSALHIVERYANNPVETDHGRLKARLRPMRGLKRRRSARIISAGHAFVPNLRRGHYELATEVPDRHRIRAAFDQLALTI